MSKPRPMRAEARREEGRVAALRREDGAEERVLDEGIDDVGEGGAAVAEEEGDVGRRVDHAGDVAHLLEGDERAAEMAEDLEEAVDAGCLVGEIAHEAVAVDIEPAGHRDLVAGEDDAIDRVGSISRKWTRLPRPTPAMVRVIISPGPHSPM